MSDQTAFRAIPAVSTILQDTDFKRFNVAERYLAQIVQEEIALLRKAIANGKKTAPESVPAKLHQQILNRLNRLFQPALKRVVNATGIILHTNMGRAPLAPVAMDAINAALPNYTNIEIDLNTGKRGKRMQHVEEMLCLISGAEAALVVNNCAAAILLALNTICRRKEVPVSRGELVEIGGAFRMPEVMKASGAKMVEIGATNKTHLADYESAITTKTAALLKVHTSNYRILGFTKEVDIADLAALAHQHQLPLIYDMGSGVIEDLQAWGFPHEPVARDIMEAGVDVATFSGDKILGGPQAGIIIGKKHLIDKIKKNHLTRALRCDKLIYTALEATLRLFLQPAALSQTLPVAMMMTTSREALTSRAKQIQAALAGANLKIEIIDTFSQMGSGALPLEKIPSIALQITSPEISPLKIAARFRGGNPPIVGYIQDDAFFLNLRTVREDEIPLIQEALLGL